MRFRRLVEEISRGRYGVVWKTLHENDTIAVKIVSPQGLLQNNSNMWNHSYIDPPAIELNEGVLQNVDMWNLNTRDRPYIDPPEIELNEGVLQNVDMWNPNTRDRPSMIHLKYN
ncbi:uncharacterized protein LOC107883325 [Acyrthosiphon pisum]|uniref:Protein kinase domain-containing protein n=1 Tax=Acyrthosiphon pisum TaxID=7029 RepID=A0A8R2H8B1_ACYPI|nr:uncharacterized protein LOC107883325 [Acyrthosiphon pisum]XP_029341399.1 uncharacterized protein LOC107883325 [Acyrthosiphon pisum]|eukprot:XP_016658581.1 PREDICTED: uncharacterized protein LOC107883325 [Acyrthosiphon pisum]